MFYSMHIPPFQPYLPWIYSFGNAQLSRERYTEADCVKYAGKCEYLTMS